MSRKKWAAIDEYQCGARSSGRGGWKQPSGDGRRSSPRGEAHSSGASERPIGEGCWSCGSTDHNKNKCPTREAKATEDGRGGAGGRGPSRGCAAGGSSPPAKGSGGVVRRGTGTQEPVGRTRWPQQQLQLPEINTVNRNDTQQSRARAVQVAPVPAE